ncbi:MAG: thymidine phosphorylase, partial [Clostridia bacterium]
KGTLYSLCVSLAAEMIYASTGKNFEDCKNSVIETINNGKALAKLADMVKCLGGDESCILMPEKLVVSPISFDVASTKTGYIQKISAYEIGCCALSLGTGRVTKQDKIDHGAGIILNIEKGDYVQKGQKIATFYCKDKSMLDDAARYFENSLIISAEKPKINDIIIKKIR